MNMNMINDMYGMHLHLLLELLFFVNVQHMISLFRICMWASK